jgi:hypothetical protein
MLAPKQQRKKGEVCYQCGVDLDMNGGWLSNGNIFCSGHCQIARAQGIPQIPPKGKKGVPANPKNVPAKKRAAIVEAPIVHQYEEDEYGSNYEEDDDITI